VTGSGLQERLAAPVTKITLMARTRCAAHKNGLWTNLCDNINDKIIAELEEGRPPWDQPWGTAAAQAPASDVGYLDGWGIKG